jgi:hypothetical protein
MFLHAQTLWQKTRERFQIDLKTEHQIEIVEKLASVPAIPANTAPAMSQKPTRTAPVRKGGVFYGMERAEEGARGGRCQVSAKNPAGRSSGS